MHAGTRSQLDQGLTCCCGAGGCSWPSLLTSEAEACKLPMPRKKKQLRASGLTTVPIFQAKLV